MNGIFWHSFVPEGRLIQFPFASRDKSHRTSSEKPFRNILSPPTSKAIFLGVSKEKLWLPSSFLILLRKLPITAVSAGPDRPTPIRPPQSQPEKKGFFPSGEMSDWRLLPAC